ncbi:hypothetical protein RAB80_017017 [Fusarium oxysporum f. sp. vasinfectum]|nr:hypothetical protein RAB80_017017 [Fusarium oxysporum f. sp. vasinfectum]
MEARLASVFYDDDDDAHSIRQLSLCTELKESCDIFKVLKLLRKDPGELLGLCLLSLALQMPLIMAKPVCGHDTETESSANEGILAQLERKLDIQPPLTLPEETLLSDLPQCIGDPELLQDILVRIRDVLFINPARENFRCQLVDMEKDSPFRGPVRKLIRILLCCWAKFELIKLVDNWPETQPQPYDENIKGFLEQLKYSTLPDWKHLPVQAAKVPMQMVIRHLVYHHREGFRPFGRLDFRQGQREFVRKVMDIVQMMDPVKPFDQLENLDFQRAIYEFLKAYGTSGKREITDPRSESWHRGKSSFLFWDFLTGIRQAQESKRLKLEGDDRQEFEEVYLRLSPQDWIY